jgi:hypothetical protein
VARVATGFKPAPALINPQPGWVASRGKGGNAEAEKDSLF